jgi:hypothetical protein
MCTTELRILNNYYHWMLSSYQSFSMCLYDIGYIERGNTIGYGIDGYDLCRFVFPISFFKDKPNPHHNAMCATWKAFFEESDGTTTFGIISPFAVIELLATIAETASGKELTDLIDIGGKDIRTLVKQIADKVVSFEEIEGKQKQTIQKLSSLVNATQNARDIIKRGEAFRVIENLLSQNKIKLLDFMIRKIKPQSSFPDLLSYDQKDLERGLRYLGEKRHRLKSLAFYNTLDIYHYVLFENADSILKSQNMQAYISSSGILSRNSWLLTKYGKLPDTLANIPDDWSARSSDVPHFVSRSLNQFNRDARQLKYFFEECISIARIILRDIYKVPEMQACINRPIERQQLLASNPIVKVSNDVPNTIRKFHNDYHRILLPQFNMPTFETSAQQKIDIERLYEWVMDPKTRLKEFDLIANEVHDHMTSLNLYPLDWVTYIAPLGETSYEILGTFNSHIDR